MALYQRYSNPLPRLYLISSGKDDPYTGTLLMEQIKLLPHYLSCIVQIREKHFEAKQLFYLALKAAESTLSKEVLLVINERVDIAVATGLQGVHLPENSCPPDKLRTVAPELLIGCSVHSPSSALIAEESGADYLLFGPVFDTPSKRKYGLPQGSDKLGKLCRSTSLPVFAVGGITHQNASQCIDNGAYGVAGISLFVPSAKFIENVEKFYRILYT
ncbi:MAG: thiamine phosphate synthase [Chlorobiaceae bacterium]